MKSRCKYVRACRGLNLEQLERREMLTADAFEQHAVYLINVERHQRDLPPLAINGRLMESAGGKAADLDNCFAHLCNGKDQNDWAADAGFDSLVDEVIAALFPPGDVTDQARRAVDQWMSSSLHRSILMGDRAEFGIGRTKVGNTVYWAGQLGTSDPDAVFLTGTVFNDRNRNQRYDYGEGLSGVTVSNGDSSTKTNAGGGWKLSVAPHKVQNLSVSGGSFGGESNVQVNVQNKSRSVDFAQGGKQVFVDFALISGTGPTNPPDDDGHGNPCDDDNHPNHGQAPTGRVSGRVFVDLDEDGERSASEELLANWIVYIDTNGNRRRDASEPQTFTDASGRYEFELRPAVPAGFGHHVSLELKPHFDNTTRLVRSVLIQAGTHKTNKDFGVIRENGVSGFVFHDTNHDGVKNRTERRLEGWTVFVDSNQNGRLDAGERWDVTNANGRFVIKSLQPGVHTIALVPKSGFDSTTISARSVSVQAADFADERNFGVLTTRPKMIRPPRPATKNTAQISGRVFDDVNSDGQRNVGEKLLADWIVFVDANRNGQRDPSELTTLTDGEGRYQFTLPTSTYWIAVEQRAMFDFTTGPIRSVSISDGQDRTQRDFGVIGTFSISATITE